MNQHDLTELLKLHQQMIKAHVEDDVESWLALEADSYTSVNRGEITHPTKADRKAQREPYLDASKFTVYRDLVEPIVKISDDGTLGWLITQVEVEGTQQTTAGETVPFRFVSAWIELYEKRDGRWLCTGNVSNMKS